MPIDKKKKTVSIRIPNELMPFVNEIGNKSKFFEGLLVEYFKENK